MTIGDMNISRKEDMIKLIDILQELIVDLWLKKSLEEEDFDRYKISLYELQENLK